MFKPDVIHVHVPNTSAFFLLGIKKIPIVLHWHSDVVETKHNWKLYFLYKIYRQLERKLIKNASAIITTSVDYAKTSKPLADFSSKVASIPLALDLKRLPKIDQKAVQKIRKIHGSQIVLSVGRFTYYKGFEYLVRAGEFLKEGKILIIGKGPLFPKIKEMVDKGAGNGRVELLGFVDDADLVNYYEACDCFCLSSIERTEAFGLVLLEAMNYSKPLITTTVKGSGMNFVNQPGITGYQVEPENPQALGDAMNELLINKEQSREIGKNAHTRLTNEFSLERTVKAISKLYSTIQTPPISG